MTRGTRLGAAPDAGTPSPRPVRVVIDVGEEALLDEVLGTCATQGITARLASGPDQVRAAWSGADLVVLDAPAARRLGSAPSRRRNVVLASGAPPGPEDWRDAVAVGAEHVVAFPDDVPWLLDRLAELGPGQRGSVVGVVGARGGVGCSTLAASMSVVAGGDGLASVLVDIDPTSGGIDMLLGAEDVPGVRWRDVSSVDGRLDSAAFLESLPAAGPVHFLTHDPDKDTDPPTVVAVSRVLDAARRVADLVVLDIPRWMDADLAEVVDACELLLLVTPTDSRGLVAGRLVGEQLRRHGADVRAVLRARRSMSALDYEDVLGLPVAAVVRDESALVMDAEYGIAPGTRGRSRLRRTARHLVKQVMQPSSVAGAR